MNKNLQRICVAVDVDEYEGWRCGDCAEEVDALLHDCMDEELKND